jgi:hypothetical protein
MKAGMKSSTIFLEIQDKNNALSFLSPLPWRERVRVRGGFVPSPLEGEG